MCDIPSMSAHLIADELREMARESTGAIVEVGVWLGHGTRILAEAGKVVHGYDRFEASLSEVEKARRQGVCIVAGQDTMPMVRDSLPDNVVLHKGDVKQAKWTGEPIGLYVDDAAKQLRVWEHIVSEFLTCLCDGAFVVLMDYRFPKAQCQRDYMAQHTEFITIPGWSGEAQAFVYKGQS